MASSLSSVSLQALNRGDSSSKRSKGHHPYHLALGRDRNFLRFGLGKVLWLIAWLPSRFAWQLLLRLRFSKDARLGSFAYPCKLEKRVKFSQSKTGMRTGRVKKQKWVNNSDKGLLTCTYSLKFSDIFIIYVGRSCCDLSNVSICKISPFWQREQEKRKTVVFDGLFIPFPLALSMDFICRSNDRSWDLQLNIS